MFLGSICYLVLYVCASITVDKAYGRPSSTTSAMLCIPPAAQSTVCCAHLPKQKEEDDEDLQHLCLLLSNEGDSLIATESIQNVAIVMNTSISSIGVICENLETKGGQTCIDVTRYDRSEFCFSTLFTNNSDVIKTLPICLDLPSMNVTRLAGLPRRAFPDFGGLTTIISPAQFFYFISRVGGSSGSLPGLSSLDNFSSLPGFGPTTNFCGFGGFGGIGSGLSELFKFFNYSNVFPGNKPRQ